MKLGTALRLGRVSNLPTVWTNAVAGIVLAGARPGPRAYVCVAAALSLFYVGGMYLNDAFDREHDARVRPDRPIPAGEVAARTVFVVGYAMLGLGGLLAAASAWLFGGSPLVALAAALALGAAIVFYDAHHKHNPWSPLVMALCRVLSYVTAGLCVATSLPALLFVAAAGLLLYLVGLTYVAKRDLLGPRGVGLLIAGISLYDAAWVLVSAEPQLALLCACGFALTRLAQRFVSGT